MKENKKGGYFLLARSFLESELWLYKPATWSKIWVYILEGVNYEASKTLERGEGYFNFTEERRKIGKDVAPDIIKKALRYFKDCNMISTTKSTRGMRIKVLNYAKYQDFCKYVGTTPSTDNGTLEAPHKHHTSTTIPKGIKTNKTNNKVAAKAADLSEKIKDEDIKMDYLEFTAWCSKSSLRAVKLIGEWADTLKPAHSNKAQWKVFMKRNLRAANDLAKFTDDQIVKAFSDIQKEKDWLRKPTLETILKFLV